MSNLVGCMAPGELTEILGDITIHGVYKYLKTNNIDLQVTKSRRKRIPPIGVRKILLDKGFEYPTLNTSFQIVKGGAGKTSLSYGLGTRASLLGARVLLVDLDKQGNLTRSFKIDARDNPVFLNILRDKKSIESAIIELSDTLHILPSNLNNSRLDLELTQSNFDLRSLIRDELKPIRDRYDLVIMDCPPDINKITVAATCSSDLVIIPMNPDPYAIDGIDFTINELKTLQKKFKLSLNYRLVWNKYDARERLGNFYLHDITKDEEKYKNLLPVVIRIDTSLKNSIFDEVSLADLPKDSNFKEDSDHFAKEILGLNQWIENRRQGAK